jgi:hypothetical protein
VISHRVVSAYKTSEGGFGQRLALELLRGEGIRAEPATSPYVLIPNKVAKPLSADGTGTARSWESTPLPPFA